MTKLLVILAALSIWDYPARFPMHNQLRKQFVTATREGDTATMEETCRKGVRLLPDDPTWHYNLACSLAYFPKRFEEAFDELEKAIDLGFKDVKAIEKDTDLIQLAKHRRYAQTIEYAKEMKSKPMMFGPMAAVDATGIFGQSVALGAHNMGWDFETGCFLPRLKLAKGVVTNYTGFLYMNRDGGHSPLNIGDFPGITDIRLDKDGVARRMDRSIPNLILPYPTFGNSSTAYTDKRYWRSLSRTLTTTQTTQLKMMEKAYLKNQFWIFPSNCDTPPVGTNGDVFASITPFWLTTAGRSFSDMPYLRAALKAASSFRPEVKAELIKRGLLTPTLMTLIRKSLGVVKDEDDYITSRAHPTAMPPNGLNVPRLLMKARELTLNEIPPLVALSAGSAKTADVPIWSELVYATPFAWSFILRSEDMERSFNLRAVGAEEVVFVQTHGEGVNVKINRTGPNTAVVTFNRKALSPTNRIDIAAFGRNKGTGWGAPSYISFARMDPEAPYSDPAFTILKAK